MEPAVRLTDVQKVFHIGDGEHVVAVDGLSLTIPEGEIFALVGPDGAGKTTSLRMMCGVLRPSRGDIEVAGLNMKTDREQIKKHIGYLSQRFSLYADLSIDENIDYFADIHRISHYEKAKEELLEFTRLTPFRDRLAGRLSGGMKQKLALACTLIHRPKVLFLDEPTTGVDPVSRRDFWGILQSLLGEGITIVMSTPYLDEAERSATVALMNEGTLMEVDSPQRLRRFVTGEVLEIVCEPVKKAISALKGHEAVTEVQAFGDRVNVVVENPETDEPRIKAALSDASVNLLHIRRVNPTLEHVYVSLLTHPKQKEVHP